MQTDESIRLILIQVQMKSEAVQETVYLTLYRVSVRICELYFKYMYIYMILSLTNLETFKNA